MKTTAFQDLKQNAEDVQKKLDKYEQTLFRIYNSEKGNAGQESFVQYLTDSIDFYRARQSRLLGLMDNIIGGECVNNYNYRSQTPPISMGLSLGALSEGPGLSEKSEKDQSDLSDKDEEDLFDEDKEELFDEEKE